MARDPDYQSWLAAGKPRKTQNPKKSEVDPYDLRQATDFPEGTAVRVWGYTDPRLLNNKHLLGEHREVHALIPRINGWAVHPEYARFHDLHDYPEPSVMAWTYREVLHPPGTLYMRAEPSPPVDLSHSSVQGVSFLLLRHELLRMAMNERWRNQHSRAVHTTQVPLRLITRQHQAVLRWYAKEVVELGRIWPDPVEEHEGGFDGLYWAKVANQRFKRAMFQIRFPHCILSPEYNALPPRAMDHARALHSQRGASNIPPGADTPWERDFAHLGDLALREYLLLWDSWDKRTHHIHHRTTTPKGTK